MVILLYIYFIGVIINLVIITIGMKNERTYVVYPDSVGEWAGLNDKNGQEIYEGDVVLQQGYNGKKMPMAVRFEKGAFIVGYHKGSSTRKTPMLVSSKCEVIDNVFDNPKLEQSLNK